VERPDESGGDVLPDEHRPRHVDVCSGVAAEIRLDRVREVLVARNDPDLQLEPRPLLELRGVALNARGVRVRVRWQEPHAGHVGTSSFGNASARNRSRASTHPAVSSGSKIRGPYEARTTSRASSSEASSPTVIAWTRRFPSRVASSGPASTGIPVAP